MSQRLKKRSSTAELVGVLFAVIAPVAVVIAAASQYPTMIERRVAERQKAVSPRPVEQPKTLIQYEITVQELKPYRTAQDPTDNQGSKINDHCCER